MRTPAPRAGWPWLALVTLTAAGAAAAAGYALTAPKHYEATAQLLVVPVDDAAFTGIDVLRDSRGGHTAAASAAALVRGPLVADAVRASLGLSRSRDALLSALDTHVVDASDVVDVTVDDTSANGAAQIANAFADTLVDQRTATFQSELVAAVHRYASLVSRMSPEERSSAAGSELMRRLAVLQGVQGRPDPSLRHAGRATPPATPSSPGTASLVGIGSGLGAAAGVVAAVALLLLRRRSPAGPPGEPVSTAVEELVERLEERLAARESAFAARERDLHHAVEELRAERAAASAAADTKLAARERRLEERVAAVARREAEVARRAAELAVREREPQPQPGPGPPPARRSASGAHTIVALERLVHERGSEFPDRLAEWTTYLYHLREYARPDGSVPAEFDGLVADAFADLLR